MTLSTTYVQILYRTGPFRPEPTTKSRTNRTRTATGFTALSSASNVRSTGATAEGAPIGQLSIGIYPRDTWPLTLDHYISEATTVYTWPNRHAVTPRGFTTRDKRDGSTKTSNTKREVAATEPTMISPMGSIATTILTTRLATSPLFGSWRYSSRLTAFRADYATAPTPRTRRSRHSCTSLQ